MTIRRLIRPGEALAIQPDAIMRDADGLFVSGTPVRETEHIGGMAVVHVRGALVHFEEWQGDSYEAIVKRVAAALERKPAYVVFRIESPGGLVSGLNEMAITLRRMSADAKVPFVAFVDELAASAAYALCCACEEVYGPPSAIIGSVGVISTMISVAENDKSKGIDVRLITSGARKADGHLHAPITDDAEAAERARNTQMAAQFFSLASTARGVSAKSLASLEAAIYLTGPAVAVGLADGVMSWAEMCQSLGVEVSNDLPGTTGEPGGNITDRRAKEKILDTSAQSGTTGTHEPQEDHMLKLAALIASTSAAIAAEADPRRRARLAGQLATYEATRRAMGGESDDEDDDEDDEDSASKKAAAKADLAKRKATAAGHRAKAAEHKSRAAECEDAARKAEEEDEEEDEDESSEASASIGMSDGAAAAIASQARMAQNALDRVAALEADAQRRNLRAMVDEALAGRRVTRDEAKSLAKKSLSFVQDFLDMRKTAIVATQESQLEQPNPRENSDIEPSVMAGIDQIVANLSEKIGPEAKAKIKQDMINGRREVAAKNGVGNAVGRY